MTVALQNERIQVQYNGFFAEPAFETLGSPAKLYASMLKRLGPLGATARSLSIDLAVLAEANVTCLLGSHGAVRVWLNRVEVFIPEAQSQQDVAQAITAAWALLDDVDTSLKPVRHDLVLSSWSRFENESYSSYIQRFVKHPVDHWKATVLFKRAGDSVQLDEAADIPEGLFLRVALNLGDSDCDIDRLMHTFRTRFQEQLNALDLGLSLKP